MLRSVCPGFKKRIHKDGKSQTTHLSTLQVKFQDQPRNSEARLANTNLRRYVCI
jgi:hypothetical protein